MSQAELIQRAKQGEPGAIARLLHLSLYTRGIRVKAHSAPDRLQILLEAHQFPERHHLINFIHQGLTRLDSQAFKTVEIYARHPDTTQFLWTDGFDIRASQKNSAHPAHQAFAPQASGHPTPPSSHHAETLHAELGATAALPSPQSMPSTADSTIGHLSPQELAKHAQMRLSRQKSAQGGPRQHPTNDLGWMLVEKLRVVNPFAMGLMSILALHSIFGSHHYTPAGFMAARDPMMMFLHNINLIIHEAGHPIFGILGQFMGLLGGSLMQVLVPAVIAGYFIITRQNYAWAIALWWMGQSILDVSLYIKDAQERALPLLGGEAVLHDWHFLLLKMHLLPYDDLIASVVFSIGILAYMIAIPAGTYYACRKPTSATQMRS
jgi:hypothetical protein